MSKMLSPVRIAGPADHDEIMRLFWLGHAENGLFEPDVNKVEWWLARTLMPELLDPLDTGPRGAIGVVDGEAGLEGMAFLIIGGFWYTNHRHLEEFIVYVDPKHRVKGHHKALIDWMKDQSLATGLPLMTGILSTQPRTEAKVRLYERMLPKAGAFFCFNPLTAGSSLVRMMH